eukprot:RCo038063
MEYVLELLRRLPPQALEPALAKLSAVVSPEVAARVAEEADHPLGVALCPTSCRQFLTSEYNRDGDSYRSPWSNQYIPVLPEGTMPSDRLRELEVQANQIFAWYREAYYDQALSSVYFWDMDPGFGCAVLFKKEDLDKESVWDSTHLFEAQPGKGSSYRYKLTSTFLLQLRAPGAAALSIHGSLTRQSETELEVNSVQTHIVNLGNLVQEMENRVRTTMDQVYFGKAVEVTDALRSKERIVELPREGALATF